MVLLPSLSGSFSPSHLAVSSPHTLSCLPQSSPAPSPASHLSLLLCNKWPDKSPNSPPSSKSYQNLFFPSRFPLLATAVETRALFPSCRNCGEKCKNGDRKKARTHKTNKQTYDDNQSKLGTKGKSQTSTPWQGLLLSTEWSPERRENAHVSSGPAPSSPAPLLWDPRLPLGKEKGRGCLCQLPGVLGWPASPPLAAHLLSSQLGAGAAALGCLFPMVQNWFG